jgi:hypothetical protein
MVDLESTNDLKLSDEIIDVSEVKQPSNNDIVNPMARPKKNFSREECTHITTMVSYKNDRTNTFS